MHYPRILQNTIEQSLFKWEVIILYGARQVGKTTLVKNLGEKLQKKWKYLDCDLLENRQLLESQSLAIYQWLVYHHELLIIDEAQRVKNIGLALKILHDNFPKLQIIATGSSSFDLANKINEPLTWRAREFLLPPLSFKEVYPEAGLLNPSEWESHLLTGWYPGTLTRHWKEAERYITQLASNYLYKDILERANLKKSPKLLLLLQLLALQIGSEVSFTEIGQKLQISYHTVQEYVALLEKSFVIFSLPSFAKNLRNELTKSVKIYFWDLGIRNALVENFQKTRLRTDIGALWENFALVERYKLLINNDIPLKGFFWRTYQQQEIDYLEQRADWMMAFEYKRSEKKKLTLPKSFSDAYPWSYLKVISPLSLISHYQEEINKRIDR